MSGALATCVVTVVDSCGRVDTHHIIVSYQQIRPNHLL